MSSVLSYMISLGNGMLGPKELLHRVTKMCSNVWLSWRALDIANLAVCTYLLMKPLLWGYRGLLVLWVISCCTQNFDS